MKHEFLCVLFSALIVLVEAVHSREVVVRRVDLPGVAMEQEVTYSTSRADYERQRDERLARLRKGDSSASVNPASGPWMLVETTATIGLAYQGIGSSSGRKQLRRITAAEEALYLYERGR